MTKRTPCCEGHGVASMAMCPRCGELQLTLPAGESKNVTVAMEFEQAMRLTLSLMRLCDAYVNGVPAPADTPPMPIPCCADQRPN